MAYEIFIKRELRRKEKKLRLDQHVQDFLRMSFASGRGKGWNHDFYSSLQRVDRHWHYVARVTLDKVTGHKRIADEQWVRIINKFKDAISTKRWEKVPFEITKHTEVSPHITAKVQAEKPQDDSLDLIVVKGKPTSIRDYGCIALNRGNYFDHIYDREPHILRIYASVETAVETQLQSRHHCLLYGPPGCGKSEILLSFGRMFGKEQEAYLKFDATSMTQAGVLNILMGQSVIPPIMIVEEIEKTSDKDLRWLLGLLDKRGEIRQTNFRVGNRLKGMKVLCLATVNDMPLFKKAMSGALASRFSHKIYCPRPDRVLMRRILEREVKSVKNGNPAWIDATLDFCMDELKWNDPREIIPICMDGKDRLLDGSYQTAVRATMEPPEDF